MALNLRSGLKFKKWDTAIVQTHVQRVACSRCVLSKTPSLAYAQKI